MDLCEFSNLYINENDLIESWGNEIYEGKGIFELIFSEVKSVIKINKKKRQKFIDRSNFIPPPRLHSNHDYTRPSAPYGLRIYGLLNIAINIKDGNLMPYYVDKNVEPGKIYKYSLVLYDSQENFSYPIDFIIKFNYEESYPTLLTYEEYKDNSELMEERSRYLEKYNLKSKVSHSNRDCLVEY